MEDREEQRLQHAALGAFLPTLFASRPRRRSPGLSGCPPQPGQSKTGPSAGLCLPQLGPGWRSALLLRTRFWGTVPRAKERGRFAPKHQAEAYSDFLLPPLPDFSDPFQFHGLSLLLFQPLQGDIPVEFFCFVGGCREIVLCFVISLGMIVSPVFSCCLSGRVVGGSGKGEGPRARIVCFGRKKKEKEQKYIYHSRKINLSLCLILCWLSSPGQR